eukprot:CAMPEP_0172447928 /NCGR_PEP_ID=MMETSP1065-20121228/7072_1 /TAXON_ID=265537 /ORGANISM="Amphiprora paludosa, Strain CCMP125" /LENGTH=104 /DNA_ID=CAMNT_0013199301 /DNA_START=129 /DNA_END=443 /DNA_ORIENTATION=-
MRISLLLLLGTTLSTLHSSSAELTIEDIIAKEQAWAKQALERRGHAIAGSSYLDELLNMDHHITPLSDAVPKAPQKNLRSRTETAITGRGSSGSITGVRGKGLK